MDFRNSGLIVATYLVFGLVVAGAAGICWLVWQPSGNTAALLQVEPEEVSATRRTPPRADDGFIYERQEAFAEAARRIKQLEALLERKTELLNQRTELLNKRTAEYDALREEADRYLMLLLEQLDPPMPETPTGDQDADRRRQGEQQARGNLRDELRRLRGELERSDLQEEALQGELEQLRGELIAAEQQLAEVELEQLLGNTTAGERPLATEALMRVGAEATPVLMVALRDERPDIRRWAAEVLEQLGPAGADAVPALRTARQDTDPAVRQAAQRALRAVTVVEP